jgi:hypothetical protein
MRVVGMSFPGDSGARDGSFCLPRDQLNLGGPDNASVLSAVPASTRYELCEPVTSRLWGLKALGALIVGLLLHDDPGYRGGHRYRVRDKLSGEYVYEVTTSPGGLDAQEAQRSLSRDLDRLTIDEFERLYSIVGGGSGNQRERP